MAVIASLHQRNNNKSMKGNDGRGARRKLYNRLIILTVILAGLGVVLGLVLSLFVVDPEHAHEHRERLARSLGNIQSRASSKLRSMGGKTQHFLKEHLDSARNRLQRPPESEQRHEAHRQHERSTLLEDVLNARVHLVNLHMGHEGLQEFTKDSEGNVLSYEGVHAEFCRLNWKLHKEDPSSTPMFRDLQRKSPDCSEEGTRTMPLHVAIKAVREFDAEHDGSKVKVLNLTSVVFHESRCGSTLVANMAVAANPTKHRVYSESAPPIFALRHVCGEANENCPIEAAAAVLRDTLYLMSRSDDLKEERVFFKIQSIGTRSVSVFQEAFPKIPWLFVYRDPVQVLMSQLAMGKRNANCVRSQPVPGPIMEEMARHYHVADLQDMEYEDYCALHLASITESAVEALEDAKMEEDMGMGIAVNYQDLPGIFYDDILPMLLGVHALPFDDLERVKQVSTQYSKGRGGRSGEFKQDSEQKDHDASPEVRHAAEEYLSESFEALEAASKEFHDLITAPQ